MTVNVLASDASSTRCSLIKIVREDAEVFGVTDFDTDITYDGVTYVSASGYTPTDYEAKDDVSVSNADVEGLFDAAGIDKADAAAGLFDNAQIEIFLYDWDAGTLVRTLAKGWWGEVKLYNKRYVAEFRSLTQKMNNTLGRVIKPVCDAVFCDSRCTLDVAGFTLNGAIAAINSNFDFDISFSATNDIYRFGVITMTSGQNEQITKDIKQNIAGNIILYQPFPFTLAVNDRFSIVEGCDKTIGTCVARSNQDNFRGFPFVPSPDKAFKING